MYVSNVFERVSVCTQYLCMIGVAASASLKLDSVQRPVVVGQQADGSLTRRGDRWTYCFL